MEKAPTPSLAAGLSNLLGASCLLAAVALQKIHRVHGYGVATHGVSLVVHQNLLYVFSVAFVRMRGPALCRGVSLYNGNHTNVIPLHLVFRRVGRYLKNSGCH